MSRDLVQNYRRARKDKSLVVLEGFHVLKHAIRFQAEIVDMVSPNKEKLIKLADRLAKDCCWGLDEQVSEISEDLYKKLAPFPPRTGVIAIAKRPKQKRLNDTDMTKPLVWLDDPRDLENIGAVIRVSAGADAAGVVVNGRVDPWNPAAVRGSAGLHFALPVIKTSAAPKDTKRKVVVYDLAGTDMNKIEIPAGSTLVFGSERSGVSKEVKNAADMTVRIPMKKGVSSLNLATSVAIGVYSSISQP